MNTSTKKKIVGVLCAVIIPISGAVGWFATQLGFKNININNIKGYFTSVKEGNTEEYKATVKREGKLKEIKRKFGEEVYNQQIALITELKNLPPDVDPNTPGLTETEKTVWEMTANLKSKFNNILKPEFDSEGFLINGTYVTKINNVYRNNQIYLDLDTVEVDGEGLLVKQRGLYDIAGPKLFEIFGTPNVLLSAIKNQIKLENNMFINFKTNIGFEDELSNSLKENYIMDSLAREYTGQYNAFNIIAEGTHKNAEGLPINTGYIIECKNTENDQSEYISLRVDLQNFETYEEALSKSAENYKDIIKQPKRIPLGEEYIEWKEVINNYFE